MANRSKQKGDREERDVVNTFREWGLTAERTLESGARSDGTPTHDINLFINDERLKGECKHRESFPAWLWEYMGENDFLTLRKNRKERLYVVPEKVFKRLVEGI